MPRPALKTLLATLTPAQQRDLIVVFMRWMNQQVLVGYADGSFVPREGGIEPFLTIPRETLALLDACVADNDASKSLKTGVADIFRQLPLTQRGSVGPQLNTYLRAHLDPEVFRLLYASAGLDLAALRYDLTFPTGPIPGPGAR